MTTSERENLTGDYNTRNILPHNTFAQRIFDNLVLLVLGSIAITVAYAVVTLL